ncbi:TPA: nucleotidyltransferase domain-containing protein, partial [Candidatus Bathyarchaeota archaeon]|nr:nucleotidyltransferase domain-containing protein [Candidatus Bathyarchaeota archaeon]
MSGIMGNPRKLAEFLKDVASSLEGVKVLVLFGSYAEDRAMPASDLDLAVVAEDLSNIANLRYAVAKGLKMPEQKVSIVELMHAPPTLKAKILKRGVVIFGDIGEIARSVKPDVIEVLDL